jgi:hypothetical protein
VECWIALRQPFDNTIDPEGLVLQQGDLFSKNCVYLFETVSLGFSGTDYACKGGLKNENHWNLQQ